MYINKIISLSKIIFTNFTLIADIHDCESDTMILFKAKLYKDPQRGAGCIGSSLKAYYLPKIAYDIQRNLHHSQLFFPSTSV